MDNRFDGDEISVKDLFQAISESKKIIIAMALLGGLVGGGLTIWMKPHLYEAACLMRLGVVLDRPIEPMERLIEVLREPNTLIQIAKKLSHDTNDDALEKLASGVYYSNRAGFLEIKARLRKPQDTIRYVNSVSEYVLERLIILFGRYQGLYKSQLNEILNFYKQNPLNIDARTLPLISEPTELVVPPVEPKLPLRRGLLKNILIGSFAGVILVVLLIFAKKGIIFYSE